MEKRGEEEWHMDTHEPLKLLKLLATSTKSSHDFSTCFWKTWRKLLLKVLQNVKEIFLFSTSVKNPVKI